MPIEQERRSVVAQLATACLKDGSQQITIEVANTSFILRVRTTSGPITGGKPSTSGSRDIRSSKMPQT